MRIQLQRFRCHNNLDIEFPLSRLILLVGQSGSGKSTILEAFRWCLFGGRMNVAPQNVIVRASNPTKVIITLPEYHGVVISRCKPPDKKVSVTYRGSSGPVTLENEDAQNYICTLFGSKTIWQASSYINQCDHNIFMSLSNAEKMEALQEITFGINRTGPNSPDYYIDTINSKIETIKESISTETNTYNGAMSMYDGIVSDNSTDIKIWNDYIADNNIPESDTNEIIIKTLQQQLRTKTELLNTLRQNERKARDAISRRQTLEESLAQSQKHLTQLETSFQSEITKCALSSDTTQLNGLLEISACQNELHRLESKTLPTLHDESILDMPSNQRNLKVQKAYNMINERTRCNDVCVRCGVQYTPEDINTYMNELSLDIKTQIDLKNKYTHYQNIMAQRKRCIDALTLNQKQYDNIVAVLREPKLWWSQQFSGDCIPDNITVEVSKLQLRTSVLVCPCCRGNLRLVNNVLEPCEHKCIAAHDASTMRAKLLQLKASLQQMTVVENNLNRAQNDVAALGPEPEAISGDMKSPSDLDAIRSTIALLKGITFPSDFSDTTLASLFIEDAKLVDRILNHRQDIKNCQERYQQLSRKYPGLSIPEHIDVEAIRNRISALNTLRSQITEAKRHVEYYSNQVKNVVIVSDVQTITNDITAAESDVSRINTLIRCGGIANNVQKKYDQLEGQRCRIVTMNERESTLLKLKALVDSTISHALQEMVDIINTTMNQIAQELFDDSIILELRLFKELKDSRVKNQVNLHVNYRGFDYDSTTALSGGEQDRVSLALTCAIAQVTNPPVLLLDECTASLDATLREACTKILRKYLRGTTVIVICHETVEGDYDQTIKI